MLLVPGLAVPAGTNLYEIINKDLHALNILFQNFYIIKAGDFFVILLIQQISFGFFASMVPFSALYNNYFSPHLMAGMRSQPAEFRAFFEDEGNTFEFGFNYSQTITILAIIFVYS